MSIHNPWTTLSGEEKYDNPWINVTEYQVLNPSGGRGIYGKVHFKNYAIAIVPIDEEGNTWLVGQYRYPLDIYSWELPEGGCIIGKEEPLAAAKRELLEECGIIATDWQEVMRLHTSNSVTDELGIVYLAQGLSFTNAEPEETEELALRKVPFTEVLEMIMRGEITDAFTICAVLKTARLLGI